MNFIKSKLSKISVLLILVVIISCGRNKLPDNYYKVGETVYELKSGTIINKGAVDDGFNIDLRLYCENTQDFISFNFVSEQAESLASTTHSDFSGSWVVGYNSNGSYTNLGNITSGSLIINRSADGYQIEFDCIDQYSNNVVGEFKGNLSKVDENNLVHVLPDYVLPEEIYNTVNQYIPIYSGVTPPDMKGEYVSSPHALIYESYAENPDSLQFYSDRYVGFLYNNNQMNFYGKQFDSINNKYIEEIQYGVKITGENDYFTCYYVVDGYPGGYYAQQSFIFSGKKTAEGLEDFHAAVILLETSNNPSMYAKNSFRVLKDYDGIAEEENWLSKSVVNTKKSSGKNNDLFDIWMK